MLLLFIHKTAYGSYVGRCSLFQVALLALIVFNKIKVLLTSRIILTCLFSLPHVSNMAAPRFHVVTQETALAQGSHSLNARDGKSHDPLSFFTY